LEQIPIVHVHELIHSGRRARRRRSQRRSVEHSVKVAQDRLRLEQAEVAMLDDWHAAERMARQMLR
jgi:hypothetical protein